MSLFKRKKKEEQKDTNKLTWLFSTIIPSNDTLHVKNLGPSTEKLTMDELEEKVHTSISKMFRERKKQMEGKDVSVGVFTFPFLSTLFEDELHEDEKWQRIKKDLNDKTNPKKK